MIPLISCFHLRKRGSMIRSSLESKLYILQGTRRAHQSAAGRPTSRPPPGDRLTAPQHSHSSRRWSKSAWIAVSAGLAVLAFLIYRMSGASFEWERFLSTLYRIDWRWLTVSILLALLGNIGRALRWEVMLRPLGRKTSL